MQTSVSKGAKKNNGLLQRTLEGAQYPLAKSQMIEVAELNFADGDILDVLYALGDSNYYCLADVQEEIHYLLHDDRIKISEDLIFEAGFDEDDEDEDDDDDVTDDKNITEDRIDKYILSSL